MKFLDLLRMSVNNLRRRKLRTALTVLGVIIGTASIVVTVSLGIGLRELNLELIESEGSLTSIQVWASQWQYDEGSETEPNYMTDEVVAQIGQMEHVTTVYPMLTMNVMMRQGIYEASWMRIMGVPREYLEQIPLGQGALPEKSSEELELIYGNQVIRRFSNSKSRNRFGGMEELPDVDFIGKPMFVIFDTNAYYQSQGDTTVKAPKKYLLKTAGIVEGSADKYNSYSSSVYVELEALKTQLRRIFKKKPIPDQPTNKKGKPYDFFVYTDVEVIVDKVENVEDVQKKLVEMGYDTNSNIDWMKQTEQQSKMIQTVLGSIGAVSLFVAAIGIANTMMMSIYERTREIGVIKVLGCDMRAIRNMFLLESGFIGFMGGVTGIGLSYTLSYLLNRFVTVGEQMTGMAGNISRIPSWLALASVVFAIMIGMLAGFFPALRAMRLSPLAAIRNE